MADKKSTKRASRSQDISGARFGRLTVLSLNRIERVKRGTKKFWNCLCDCGTQTVIPRGNLSNGHTQSCGCHNIARIVERNTKHGLWKTSEFNIWLGAKGRCFTPTNHAFLHYGGRGITMCEAWKNDFAQFLNDMGQRPPGLTLERIDNDGNYEPSNCRWATQSAQCRNQRRTIRITHEGETLSLSEWSERSGISHGCLIARYLKGSPLFAPVRHQRRTHKVDKPD